MAERFTQLSDKQSYLILCLGFICGYGGMADTTDLKSVEGNFVPVQVRLPAPF